MQQTDLSRFVLLFWQNKMVFLSHFQAFHAFSVTFICGQKENKEKRQNPRKYHLRAIKMYPKDITILNLIYRAEQFFIPLVVLKHALHHLSSQKSMQQSVKQIPQIAEKRKKLL